MSNVYNYIFCATIVYDLYIFIFNYNASRDKKAVPKRNPFEPLKYVQVVLKVTLGDYFSFCSYVIENKTGGILPVTVKTPLFNIEQII